jgi:hypothetical protein
LLSFWLIPALVSTQAVVWVVPQISVLPARSPVRLSAVLGSGVTTVVDASVPCCTLTFTPVAEICVATKVALGATTTTSGGFISVGTCFCIGTTTHARTPAEMTQRTPTPTRIEPVTRRMTHLL